MENGQTERAQYSVRDRSLSDYSNLEGTGPYRIIVPARATIKEQRLTHDGYLTSEKACNIADMH